MDYLFGLSLLGICISIRLISADRQIIVTLDQCGQSVELDHPNTVYLLYTGAALGDYYSPCVIDFVNNNDNYDMICIKTNETNYLELSCVFGLKYYSQGYSGISYGKMCSEFSVRPLCERSTRSSVVYRSTSLSKNNVVWLFTKKYISTTPLPTWTSWSSWSSWSSDSNDYDDDDDSDGTKESVGVTIGVIAIVVGVLYSCIKCCIQQPTTNPEDVTSSTGQPSLRTQQWNQQASNQSQYPGTLNTAGSQLQNQYSPVSNQNMHTIQTLGSETHEIGSANPLNYDWGPPAYHTVAPGQDQSYYGAATGRTPDESSYTMTNSPHQHQSSNIPNNSETGLQSLDNRDPPPSYESLNLSLP